MNKSRIHAHYTFILTVIFLIVLGIGITRGGNAATIDVYVKNVNGAYVQNASVKLYNVSWVPLATKREVVGFLWTGNRDL